MEDFDFDFDFDYVLRNMDENGLFYKHFLDMYVE